LDDPSAPSLEAGNRAILQPHDRLVQDGDFLALDGAAQFGFQRQPVGLARAASPACRLSSDISRRLRLMIHRQSRRGDSHRRCKPAMRARKTDRLTLESELRRAIEREEITILYQPIVRLEDRSIAGFEALARWDHPKLGRMSPSDSSPLPKRSA